MEQLDKMKQTSETKKIYYRNEVTKLNDVLLGKENNYINLINSILKQTNFHLFLII